MGMNQLVKKVGYLAEKLHTTSFHDFTGGWNVVDNDLNMPQKFAKVFRNVYRAQDGSGQIRFGTQLFADLTAVGCTNIIDGWYFFTYLIIVDDSGQVFAVNGQGNSVVIWSQAIASKLPSKPKGWGPLSFVCFTPFNGNLILTNGLDKPLIIPPNLQVNYLNDPATGSNINTPVARYCKAIGNYLVMAGDPSAPSTIYISAASTSGVFFNDPAPNDAVTIDLGPRVPTGDRAIKGIGRFRDKMLVQFAEAVVVATLGVYTTSGSISVHTPTFDETMDQFGSIAHRTIQTLGAELTFCDSVGVETLNRTYFNTTLIPKRISRQIDPEIQKSLQNLSTQSQLDRVFTINNRLEGQYMLFVPNNDILASTTESRCFVLTDSKESGVTTWAEFRGWNWTCGIRSAENRVFFCRNKQIYLYGNRINPLWGDYINEQETFSDGTAFTDTTGLNNPAPTGSGIPVDFDWQFPWTDFNERMRVKLTRVISLDTHGNAGFAVDTFVDNLLINSAALGDAFTDGTQFSDGYGFLESDTNQPLVPALSATFVAGDALGFGGDGFGEPFGGGRITRDERLFAWTTKAKLLKFRLWGSTNKEFRLLNMSIGYLQGGIRR